MSRFRTKRITLRHAVVNNSVGSSELSVVLSLVLLMLFGCSSGLAPPSTNATLTLTAREPLATVAPTPLQLPTQTSSPLPNAKPTITELKYRLIDQFGDVFYCDPDLYPVARFMDEQEFARRFAEIEKNTEEFQSILKRKGLPTPSLSPDQKRIVYTEYKMLGAISLEPSGDQYRFSLRVVQAQRSGFAIQGLIDRRGSISVTKREPTITTCPICLSASTLIDTPDGQALVKDLRVGMQVWTADHSGARVEGVILKIVKRSVPSGISLVHLVLDDGRELLASAGHPTADGRSIGDLGLGNFLDGGRVIITEQAVYHDGATYDLLPSGPTGSYWANGILLNSTLVH